MNRALPVSLRVPYAMGGTATVDDYTDLSPAPSDGLLFSAGETVRAITLTLSEGSRAVGKTLTVTLGESSEIKVRRSDGTGPRCSLSEDREPVASTQRGSHPYRHCRRPPSRLLWRQTGASSALQRHRRRELV